MTSRSYINIEYGFVIQDYDDGAKLIQVSDKDGEKLEFDCKDGNIFISRDMESWFSDDEVWRTTIDEYLRWAKEFFTDWNVDKETAEALANKLKPWFEQFAISEKEYLEDRIDECQRMIYNRELTIKHHGMCIESRRKEIEEFEEDIAARKEDISKLKADILDYAKQIRELNEKLTSEF